MIVIEIQNHSETIQTIRKLADQGLIGGDVVGLRHFKRERLPLIEETGTDRDAKSIIHESKEDFLYGRPMRIRSDRITYLRTVAFREEPPLSIPLRRSPLPSIDNMNYLESLDPDYCQVLYDTNQIERVSENEYWFQGDPRKAVKAILVVTAQD